MVMVCNGRLGPAQRSPYMDASRLQENLHSKLVGTHRRGPPHGNHLTAVATLRAPYTLASPTLAVVRR